VALTPPDALNVQGLPEFSATRYFFPKSPKAIFAAGEQARVPLLGGWNSEEMNYRALLGQQPPTVENYRMAVRKLYGEQAEEVLRLYPASNDEEVLQSATDLASDRFIGYSTWKWLDVHSQNSGQPVYRYFYTRQRPAMRPEMGDAAPGLAGGVVRGTEASAMRVPPARGAAHSAEIEYAMGNLGTNKVYAWTPEDYKVSEILQGYFANFIKTGNPNGNGLPNWPTAKGDRNVQVLHIDVNAQAKPDQTRERYLLLEKLSGH
jgi:para-nitrobenzyl esterase